jgi:hypothetical protein
MSDAALDQLYQAPPAEFTAVRTQLAAAATKRGDTAAARQIIAARKPTLAASIVNRFVHNTPDVRRRLSDLGDQLRAAHSAMDGARLRELSAQQRRFVDDLSQEALHAAGRTDPPAGLRADVTNTFHAAIADPDVTQRLGRLLKAERWVGFAEFANSAVVSTASDADKPPRRSTSSSTTSPDRQSEWTAVRAQQKQDLERAQAALDAAKDAKTVAEDAFADRRAELESARRRLAAAHQLLTEAETDATAAEDAYRHAEQTRRDATETVKSAKAQLAAERRRSQKKGVSRSSGAG